jgi:cytidine deaminase
VTAARRRSASDGRRAIAGVSPQALMAEAIRARRAAYAPYSRFPVGAALLTTDGQIVRGCNVENASYGMSACAERNAVWKAVSEGMRQFAAIAVTARDGQGAPPCGACRQVLSEFAPEMLVHWRDARGRMLTRRLTELLPQMFVLAPRRPPRSPR